MTIMYCGSCGLPVHGEKMSRKEKEGVRCRCVGSAVEIVNLPPAPSAKIYHAVNKQQLKKVLFGR
jgi:hypothetical protein